MHAVYRFIDRLNEGIGRVLAWFTLAMVIVQFIVVLMRYVFSAPDFLWISAIWWQELIVYMHGTLIMLGIGYTLLHNGHVRVDIFYRDASPLTRNWTDLLGSLLFLLPMCWIMWWSAWPNVETSWRMFEGSTETSGIPYKYVLKSTVLAGAVLLALQAVSTAIKAFLRIAGDVVEDPHDDEAEVI